MRIVELSTDRLPSPPMKGGAIERYVYQISQELSRLGVEVHLISIGDNYYMERGRVYRHVYPIEDMNFLENIVGKILAKITSELNRKLIYVNRILLQIFCDIQENYGLIHVIHNHYFTTSFAPIAFKRLINRRILLVNHYHNVPKNNLINKMVARHYDLHLAVSKFISNEVVRRLGVHPSKVHVIYNCIDTSRFTCDENVRDKMREIYGIGRDEIVLLYIGRITPEKGLHYLINALRIILKEISNRKITLLIAGPIGQFDLTEVKDVAYFHYIKNLSYKYGLHKNIKYVGYIANIADIYAMADIVVVPSIWQDPCPSTVLEALASCRPLVAFPVGGIPELVEGLEYDFLAKKVEPRSLAEKVICVINELDKIDFKRLREHVNKRFSTKVVAKTLKSLIEECLLYEK